MILPSEATGTAAPWSRDHLRLHRLLKRHPALLPSGARLLLAVSGGQDSMALTGLLRDLRRLHGWQLLLWHGDHGWRQEAPAQAMALAAWAGAQQLPLLRERAEAGEAESESLARDWRYRRLGAAALTHSCSRVLTGHTATDRAETMLLNLARGSHRRGLASLRVSRPLHPASASEPSPPQLVRPLLIFDRDDTARICRQAGLPVWEDSSNQDRRFARNRLRAEVLPVLEALHPGAVRRISAQAERLGEEQAQEEELLELALTGIGSGDEGPGPGLARQALLALSGANQSRLLQHWLQANSGRTLAAEPLAALLARLPLARGNGTLDLGGGWRIRWDRRTLRLLHPDQAHG